MKFKIFKKLLVMCFAIFFSVGTAFATHDLNLFELEGNALQDGVAPPVDWETLWNNGGNDGGSPLRFTNILHDEPDAMGSDDSIFTGGRKDIQDLNQWGHKSGSSPDKDEIMNAYAAAYKHGEDLIIYFGADRISNKGDAFMGFWFFKQKVEAAPDGSFTGAHTNGDILVLTNFPQASNAKPEIRVDVWDDTCNKAASNDPEEDECDAKNLRLVKKTSALCGQEDSDDACAVTNAEDGPYDNTDSPWPFQSKNSDDADVFPYESFFEGGINVSKLFPNSETCFSSFMAETRSSSEFTATLKDFVIGGFELCSVDITKTCDQAKVNAAEDGYDYDFNGVVENDGAGTIYNVLVTDNVNGQTFNLGTLAAGATASYSGTLSSSMNGLDNTVTVTASATQSGSSTITDNGGDRCEKIDLNPEIEVTKDCTTSFVATDDGVIAKVNYSGMVCNTTLKALTLVKVSVVDDSGTPSDPADDVTVLSGVTLDPPGSGTECKSYSGSYIPKDFTIKADQTFGDTVSAVGELKIDGKQAFDTGSASCPICPSTDGE
ncbi:DUF11 domain-containing protein [Thalassotalea fonticola]|uniref:DUF11 domain-containing protein n=1 Tax=Thalassotalea fonticola TaxID=3065649 RepID=A0ABZ0GSX6_9GAMM|nr:DUF11 domain-containing protein [Colwelliaceae bacterium S1-1]